MSEPNSLFAKIKIRKERLHHFLKSKPTNPQLNENWLEWWNSKQMYGKKELTQTDLRCYDFATNEAIITDFVNDPRTYSFSDYDEESETWYFGIMLFTENYFEMIPGLALIQSISKFKEFDSTDFAIIYNFFWEDDIIDVLMIFEKDHAIFDTMINAKADLNPDILLLCNTYLEKKLNEFENNSSPS
ncbi:hypothetical protein [Algoriphagus sp.]|uniref:hypothetical protein n=1 Tax=Algoriphagus sp. TaxID=1872435 RepID=UPI003F70E1BA